jgi:YVTN family beta-propeller protein
MSENIAVILASILLLGTVTNRSSAPPAPVHPLLLVANQGDHTLLILDPDTRTQIAKISVGVNGHEVIASPDGRFAYVPIYGNAGVGKPGTDGSTIDVIDVQKHELATTIDLGKPLRPHCAKFGPDGMLYVSAELDNALAIVDLATKKIISEVPTGVTQSHMFVLTPDGRRGYTSNVSTGTVSVVDVAKRSLITTIEVAKHVQRISISPDGRWVFTHDQDDPRIAVIDTTTNKISSWIPLPTTVYSSQPTPDGKWLVANAASGKIYVVSLDKMQVAETYDIPPAIGEVLISQDGRIAYVSCPQAGTIEVLNLQTHKLETPFKLTKGVDGLAWANLTAGK